MSKYIDTEKLIERLEEMKQAKYENCGGVNSKTGTLQEIQELIKSFQQEQLEMNLKPFDYIIKTEEGEFVKVYAVNNFYSEPEEFCEHGFNGRRWKPEKVDVVIYPTKHGHRRSYKYLHVNIKNERKEK